MARTLIGWLNNTFKRGDPLRKVANHTQANRIANVLLDIKGVGCRIEKPTNADGRGWKVIVDGTTDEEFPEGTPPVFAPSADYRGQMLWWDETLNDSAGGWVLSEQTDTVSPSIMVYDTAENASGSWHPVTLTAAYRGIFRDGSGNAVSDVPRIV